MNETTENDTQRWRRLLLAVLCVVAAVGLASPRLFKADTWFGGDDEPPPISQETRDAVDAVISERSGR